MTEKDPLSDIRNQSLALNYAPQFRQNLAVLNGAETEEGREPSIPLIDIYVNDLCNLRCHFCSTQFGKNNLPLRAVKEVARFNPRVITLTGGGEPTLYRDGANRIGDFIQEIRNYMGDIPLGMMTNGTHGMPQRTAEELKWLRVSLNAASPESYTRVHRRQLFKQVLENVVRYLQMDIPKVGIGFVYTPKTVEELMGLAQVILEEVFPHISEEERNRLTLQFRPEADSNYRRYEVDEATRDHLNDQWEQLSPEVKRLLSTQSNLTQVMSNECFSIGGEFSKCHISLLQMNVDAKGDVYPCPQKAHAFEDGYGNILDPGFFEQFRERMKASWVEHSHTICVTCAQSRVNKEYDSLDLKSVRMDLPVPRVFF